MILWTIQHYAAYQKMLETGVLVADESHLLYQDDFRHAYDWMAHKMKEANIYPTFDNIHYPVWAWYQWEGKRKRLDMRKAGYAKRGEKIVQLTIDIDDKDVLLSDFDLFHYVLSYSYLPSDETDDSDFKNAYTQAGYTLYDLSNFQIQSSDMLLLRDRIVKSWDRIFDLSKEDNGWLCGSLEKKSIQATIWQVRFEQIVKAEVFIAK